MTSAGAATAGATSVLPLLWRSFLTASSKLLTPVERRGGVWMKRDDLFSVAGVQGGKARTCWALASSRESRGLVTASSRMSPQLNIVAHVARKLGIPARAHVPAGGDTPEMRAAREVGLEVVQWRAGHNSVIIARARQDAIRTGWTLIPFGMECREAVDATRLQVENVPLEARRIVVPVGSGMSLAGVLWGLHDRNLRTPVLGVVVGADPVKRLARWQPYWRPWPIQLVRSALDYHEAAPETVFEGLQLDPIYEAKCIPFLEPEDILWVVGVRQCPGGYGVKRAKKKTECPR